MPSHSPVSYSGGTFGATEGFLPRLVSPEPDHVWAGVDAVDVSNLKYGSDVYGGYGSGKYVTYPKIRELFPGKRYVDFVPFRGGIHDVLDMEPGNARLEDAPGFWHDVNGKTPNLDMPGFYCSASDGAALIKILTDAGIDRRDYRYIPAHWIGPHVCAPNVCGYPMADGTQFASNSKIDSDYYLRGIFRADQVKPVPVPPVSVPGPVPVTAYKGNENVSGMTQHGVPVSIVVPPKAGTLTLFHDFTERVTPLNVRIAYHKRNSDPVAFTVHNVKISKSEPYSFGIPDDCDALSIVQETPYPGGVGYLVL